MGPSNDGAQQHPGAPAGPHGYPVPVSITRPVSLVRSPAPAGGPEGPADDGRPDEMRTT